MKKLTALLMLLCILLSATAVCAEQEITVRVDGKKVYFDVQPIITEDRILAPFRFVGEKIGAEVFWYGDTQTVKMVKGDRTVELYIGKNELWINGEMTTMDVPAAIYEGRTLIPLRAVAEALDGFVYWDAASRTAEIVTEKYALQVGGKTVHIGDAVATLTDNYLSPARVDKGLDRLDWYVFNSKYDSLIMAGVLEGKVISLLTMCTDYTLIGSYESADGVDSFVDSATGNPYGVWVGKKYSDPSVIKQNWKNVQAEMNMQVRDFVNALRHQNGLSVLEVDDKLSVAALAHSTDMAEKDYLAHEGSDGSTPWARYKAAGGTNFACGENISGGWFSAAENFDAWYNSLPHRNNMLNKQAAFIGHGFVYAENSTYKYYLTQMFSYMQ